jgi:thiol-disulfide isomerase/thioredoxin
MTLTLCAAIMQTVLLVSPTDTAENYADARKQVTETGKPMVVMVGTDWCGPCQAMKKNILPKVREHGLLKKVAFALVNADRDSELAKELTGGGPVPQLVMYCKTDRGWRRRILVGGQSVEQVEKFIKEGLASNESDQKDESNDSEDDSKT